MPTTIAQDPKQLTAQAINSISSIATLPEVTQQIIKTVEDPKSNAQQLNKIVSHDPALVTRILKVVNSAFYGLPGQIASVERAVVMLGLNAVKNLAVAASLGQMFRGTKLCDGFTAKDLWTHCVAVAVASRELAKMQKLPIADEAFLAGMIHDVGLLVSLQTWPEKLRDVAEEARRGIKPFVELEREIIGVDHQELGMALAVKWQFPRSCQQVAGFHHRPQQTVDAGRQVVTLVHAADQLCCEAQLGFYLTAAHGEPDEAAIQAVGLTPQALATLRDKLPALLQSASAFSA